MKGRRLWILAILLGLALLCGFAGVLYTVSNFLGRAPSSLVRVTTTDKNLQDAIKEARATLPEFKERLNHPLLGDRFAIKAKFTTSLEPEYLWIKDPVAKGANFVGVLDQVPIAATAIHKGERVAVKEADVVDWFLKSADGGTAGRFTDNALGASPH